MSILKLQITNPEAIVLINKIKSGAILLPVTTWFKKNKWYLVAGFVVIALITALVIGKKLSENTPIPIILPPEIDSSLPQTSEPIRSDFSGLKEDIQNLNTDMPDPYIPVFENQIDLEETVK